MPDKAKHKPFLLYILLACLTLLGLGAMGGGGALVIRPDGGLLGMPLSMLEKSPFKSFLLPGAVLFLFLGVYPLLIAYALLARPKWKWAAALSLDRERHWSLAHALYVGLILILWMDFQVMFVGYGSLIQGAYALFGVLIAVLALLPPLKSYYKRPCRAR
ncbi:MAG: hypothetical protein A2Y70_05120 [Candidatus Aminicenantes bacterium RBG_13_64_14]|nr:MAG: hypothetical protein A2Y70_05120 [Candidatus Aminicenantes bacterium RBG_13_64_14]